MNTTRLKIASFLLWILVKCRTNRYFKKKTKLFTEVQFKQDMHVRSFSGDATEPFSLLSVILISSVKSTLWSNRVKPVIGCLDAKWVDRPGSITCYQQELDWQAAPIESGWIANNCLPASKGKPKSQIVFDWRRVMQEAARGKNSVLGKRWQVPKVSIELINSSTRAGVCNPSLLPFSPGRALLRYLFKVFRSLSLDSIIFFLCYKNHQSLTRLLWMVHKKAEINSEVL